jgi:hypothetical protein
MVYDIVEAMTWDLDEADLPSSSLERAMMLQNMLISLAQGDSLDDSLYAHLRREFMDNSSTRDLLPDFVRTNRSSGALWGYFKQYSPQWAPRREHVWQSFRKLLDFLEGRTAAPSDMSISQVLSSLDAEGVHRAWEKALARRDQDPEGAITAARTLLEAVCKRILEDAGESYTMKDDLPKLYYNTAKLMNLAPSDHTEELFKTILGGCQSVVNSLGTLRNRIGDAHAPGGHPTRASGRHAALAVNLAGTMATFLVETWLQRSNRL